MENHIPEFMKDATNVYRTKKYIVRQIICVHYDCTENNTVFSRDTFYARTPKRDLEYESVFCRRKNIDGKRLPTTAYSRVYIE